MAELKTQRNDASVDDFLAAIEDQTRRDDCLTVLKMMKGITRKKPEMWGENIVGFGSYQYKYASGREGEWFLTGFSPRKQSLTVYIISGFRGFEEQLEALGKVKTSKVCLYIKKLDDLDLKVLRELIRASVKKVREGHR